MQDMVKVLRTNWLVFVAFIGIIAQCVIGCVCVAHNSGDIERILALAFMGAVVLIVGVFLWWSEAQEIADQRRIDQLKRR